jgi:hypothetical protein
MKMKAKKQYWQDEMFFAFLYASLFGHFATAHQID